MNIKYIKDAIAHKPTAKVPYLIQLTRKANEKYGEKLLQDYYSKDAMSAYKKVSYPDAMQYIYPLKIMR